MKTLNKLKTSREFLQNIFPENLFPSAKINIKQKQQIKIKIISLKKKLKEIENKVLYQTLTFLPYFLYLKLKNTTIKYFIEFKNFDENSQKGSLKKKYLMNFKSFSNKKYFSALQNNTQEKLKALSTSQSNFFNNSQKNLNNFINENYSITNYFYKKLNEVLIFQNNNFDKLQFSSRDNNKNFFKVTSAGLPYLKKKIQYLYSIDQLKNQMTNSITQTFSKKFSDFHQHLKEKKKLSILYGFLPKKQIKKLYNKAFSVKGRTDNNIFFFLERRLDIILYRAGFFKNIRGARQYITHKKILVNGKTITFATYYLNPGDIISVKKTEVKKLSSLIKNDIKTQIKSKKFTENSRFFLSNHIIQKLHEFLLFSNKLTFHQKIKTLTILRNKINFLLNTSKFLQTKSELNNFDIYKKNLIFLISLLNFFKNKNLVQKQNFYFYLKLKEKFYKKRTRRHYLAALRVKIMKPLNLEISYKYLTIIFLYYPQKIPFSALLDIDKITRANHF